MHRSRAIPFFAALFLVVQPLLVSSALAGSAAEPTADEMLFIYTLNRARANPAAYQQEVNLSVDLSGVQPRPPLAVNNNLTGSSRFHADEMADNNYFGHTSQVTGDQPNKMARDHGYPLPISLDDNANNIESIAAGNNLDVLAALKLLIEDAGVDPPGHRIHLLGINDFFARHREIGVGVAFNAASDFDNYFAIHTAFEFTNDKFLTGVVYNDANGNGRYDKDEGIAGVTVSNGTETVTTNAAGGYAFKVSAGTHTVTASGGSFAGTGTAEVTVDQDSIEIDFRSGNTGAQVNFVQQDNGGGGGGGGGGGSGTSNSIVDTDGDGFSDEIEDALGTSSTDQNSTPFGGQPAGTIQTLDLPKLFIKLNFAKAGADIIIAKGTLPIPDGFVVQGEQVHVDVGGVIKSFTLDEKGRSPKGTDDQFRIKIKQKKGVVAAQNGKFMVRFKKGDFDDELVDENLSNADLKKVQRTVIVNILFNNTVYQATVTIVYTAKTGKKGSGKGP